MVLAEADKIISWEQSEHSKYKDIKITPYVSSYCHATQNEDGSYTQDSDWEMDINYPDGTVETIPVKPYKI